MIAMRLAEGVRSHFTRRLPEWALSFHLCLYGLQLLREGGNSFAASRTFAEIRDFMTEDHWGDLAVCLSFFWLSALILNGTFKWFVRWSKWIRAVAALVVFGFWTIMTFGVLEGNEHSGAVVNFCVLGNDGAAGDLSWWRSFRKENERGCQKSGCFTKLEDWMAADHSRPALVLKLLEQHQTVYAVAVVLRLETPKPIVGRGKRRF